MTSQSSSRRPYLNETRLVLTGTQRSCDGYNVERIIDWSRGSEIYVNETDSTKHPDCWRVDEFDGTSWGYFYPPKTGEGSLKLSTDGKAYEEVKQAFTVDWCGTHRKTRKGDYVKPENLSQSPAKAHTVLTSVGQTHSLIRFLRKSQATQ